LLLLKDRRFDAPQAGTDTDPISLQEHFMDEHSKASAPPYIPVNLNKGCGFSREHHFLWTRKGIRMQQVGAVQLAERLEELRVSTLVNNNFPPLVATVSKPSLPTRVSMRSAPCSDATK